MNHDIILKDHEIRQIKKLVGEKRRELGYINTPIGCDIFSILNTLEIKLVEYPVDSGSDRQSFSAVILHVNHDIGELTFIGLNTADNYDNQIFALAHELYHYFVKTNPHLCRIEDSQGDDRIEVCANRFAAEFLLPEESMRELISDEFRSATLEDIPENTILRLVARIQCRWWVPYRTVINRLHELGILGQVQYRNLYKMEMRELEGRYGKIGCATQKDVFIRLNSKPIP